jgi:hypothetical protein
MDRRCALKSVLRQTKGSQGMNASILRLVVSGVLILAGAPHALMAQPTGIVTKSPDLVPNPDRMKTGTVSVRNVGSADAGAFVVTVVCNVQGRKGGCAESRGVSKYEDAAYPNAVVVNVPSLKAGKTFNHKLTFWNELDWAAGDYQFDVTADTGTDVAETNEGNNTGSHVMSVP